MKLSRKQVGILTNVVYSHHKCQSAAIHIGEYYSDEDVKGLVKAGLVEQVDMTEDAFVLQATSAGLDKVLDLGMA